MNAVEVSSLTKKFGDITALRGINLSAGEGEIYGLVGPDGAGKTTLIRILVGIMLADEGKVTILGNDVLKNPESIKRFTGYMSQRFSLYGDLTVKENLDFYSDLFEIYGDEKKERINRLLKFSRLGPFMDRRADALSGGMKQKLGLSCALIHTPKILFLDEPTTGVDPVSRRELWMILYDLWKEGMTIFVSTPYLDEAERCTKIGLIHKGKMITEDTPNNLKKNAEFSVLRVQVEDAITARGKLEEITDLPSYNLFGNRLHFITKNPTEDTREIRKKFKSSSINIIDTDSVPPSLEDVFLYMTSSGGGQNE
ncbi:MAG: ABC transporter ATP-binding protein [Acidobacteria bacterium]|nr:ABC transporter ATP-binding protein [Acidobacteriota bacterium]